MRNTLNLCALLIFLISFSSCKKEDSLEPESPLPNVQMLDQGEFRFSGVWLRNNEELQQELETDPLFNELKKELSKFSIHIRMDEVRVYNYDLLEGSFYFLPIENGMENQFIVGINDDKDGFVFFDIQIQLETGDPMFHDVVLRGVSGQVLGTGKYVDNHYVDKQIDIPTGSNPELECLISKGLDSFGLGDSYIQILKNCFQDNQLSCQAASAYLGQMLLRTREQCN